MERIEPFIKGTGYEIQEQRKILIESLPLILLEILEDNKAKSLKTKKNLFKAKHSPTVSVPSYFERIVKYSKMENSTMIIVLIYLDRLTEISEIDLTYNNVHKLLLAACITAIKYNEDDFFSNKFYSKVGGVSQEETNLLEEEFCNCIEFSFFVSVETFEQYRKHVEMYQKIA